MKRPTFDITLDKHGRMTVHVSGSSGKACVKLADMIREIVGREESRRLTSEYHEGGAVRIDATAAVREEA
ncbi:MAG: DUF2997 domain-containing protein [Phycisphaerales bacterium]